MKKILILITFLSSFLTFAQQAGTLDVSFGGTGIVTTSLGYPPQEEKIAIQPNGKIIVAGSYDVYNSGSGGPFPLPPLILPILYLHATIKTARLITPLEQMASFLSIFIILLSIWVH